MNDPGDEELRKLRAEVEELRARLAEATAAPAPAPPAAPPRKAHGPRLLAVRRAVAVLLVALAGFGLVASVIGVWGGRTALRTDQWVETVAPLPRYPEVNAAMATYLTDQAFAALDVRRRLEDALPPKAAFLADPVSKTVQDYLRERVRRFMGTERFAELWRSANEFAHARIVAVLEGTSETVVVRDGVVTLNLLPIVNDVLRTVSEELPTLFGKKLELPTLTSGAVPADLREKIQTAVGVTLPADFAQIPVYRGNELAAAQDAVVLFKRSLVLLVLGTLLCLVLALVVSPGRRRTVFQFGVAVAVAVVALSAVLRAVRDRLLEQVPAGVYHDGAAVAVHEVFSELRTRGDQLLWFGIVLALIAYLVGPGRIPTALRHGVVTGSRRAAAAVRTTATSGEVREWTTRNLDVLRIAGLVAAALVALLFVASWTAFLVLLVLLALYEAAVTLLAQNRWEFRSATSRE